MQTEKKNLTKVIQFRVTPDERERIHANSVNAGMSESEYMRSLVNGVSISCNANIVRDAAKRACNIIKFVQELEMSGNIKDGSIIEAIKKEAAALCRY